MLDGEQALADLAELDFHGVQAGVEACVVLAHVGAEVAEVEAKVVDAGVHAGDLRDSSPASTRAVPTLVPMIAFVSVLMNAGYHVAEETRNGGA